MAGLIWSGVGQGIAAAGNQLSAMGMRDYEMRESARLRNESREEDRAWREEQKDLDRERQDERDRLYRKTVEQQMAASKGTSGMKGFDPADLAPGGKLADMMAGQMGMTVPEYERFYNSRKTGDLSGYKITQDVGTTLDDTYGEQTVTEKTFPEGFQKEYAAKSRLLSDLQQTYVAGAEAKNIAEARQTGLVTRAMEGVQAGTGDVTSAAQLAAIGKGVAPYAGDSSITRNVLTGAAKETPVGEAQIGAENALAGLRSEQTKQAAADIGLTNAKVTEALAGAGLKDAQTGEANAAAALKLKQADESVANAALATAKAKEADAGAGLKAAEADKARADAARHAKDMDKTMAEIAKLQAETNKIKADTGQVGADKGEKTQERLSTIVNSANNTLKSLDDLGPGKTPESKAAWEAQRATAMAVRDAALAQQKTLLEARGAGAPASQSGAGAGRGTPPVRVNNEAEYKALKPGTRYIDPSGQIRMKQ